MIDRLLVIILFVILDLNAYSAVGDAINSKQSLPRIIGGLSATNVRIPYIVSLISNGEHSCGGAIVNERTIITAAHCLAFTIASKLQIHAGAKTHSLNDGVLIPAAALYFHKEWSMDTMDYDIGLVRLTQPLIYSATIQPIRLPSRNLILYDGTQALVSGWGFTESWGPTSPVLRYARVPIVNRYICNMMMENSISDRMICAGYVKGGIDACQMDSGGPLVVAQNLLVGLVSWGIGCALPNRFGVYTRVSELMPWVQDTMRMNYNEVL